MPSLRGCLGPHGAVVSLGKRYYRDSKPVFIEKKGTAPVRAGHIRDNARGGVLLYRRVLLGYWVRGIMWTRAMVAMCTQV